MNRATDAAVEQQPAKETEDRQFDVTAVLGRFAALIFLIVLGTAFAILEPAFVNPINLFNVLRQVSVYGLLAIGMTFVILTAGIDLSIGSLLALSGLVVAAVEKGSTGLLTGAAAGEASGYPLPVAILAAVIVGMAGGGLQGLAITRLRVPPFVVTLGGLSAFRGAALVFSGGQPISAFSEDFRYWGQGFIGPVPVPVVIFLSFAVLAYIVLRYTRYGRYIYAVGGNLEAARLSGLNTDRLVASVYVIMGFFAGLSGFVLAARLNSAEQVAGLGYELTVIAGVVIGGTSLFGGEGGIFGTIIGVLLIGVLNNGLTLMNVSSYYQQIIIGIIIVFAVFFDQMIKRRQR
ncbi:MAG: Ribose import permease protein RbsC [Anaerolineales bacterium]|nr:Ribose import permease protein RbsC [Anaerolineales bacterium]